MPVLTKARNLLLFSFLLTNLCWTSVPEAAEFDVVHAGLWQDEIPVEAYQSGTADESPKCNVILRGEIREGDRDRLVNTYTVAKRGRKMAPSYLCLDSPGGSFSEALAIIEWMMKGEGVGIVTFVDAGMTCLSSCALVFLAGSRIDHDITGYAPQVERWLHVRGRLGFHAPYLDPSALPERVTRDEAINFYRAAQEATKRIIAIFQHREVDDSPRPERAEWVRTSLFSELMLKRPNEFIFIDTIDAAGRWQVDLIGVRSLPGRQLSEDMGRIACRNALAWHSDRFAADGGTPFNGETQGVEKIPGGNSTRMIFLIQKRHVEASCVVDIYRDRIGGVGANVTYREKKGDGSIEEIPIGYSELYAPETKLADIAEAHDHLPSLRSADTQAAKISPAPLIAWNNYDLEGGDLKQIKNIERPACRSACEVDAACRAYAYDKWNRWCFLKASLGVLRLDPKYDSGLREGLGDPARSSAPIKMERYRRKAFPYGGQSTSAAATFEECESRCAASSSCVAVTYFRVSGQCRTMDEAPGEYFSNPKADISVKRQAAR